MTDENKRRDQANREYQRRADAMAVKLQNVVEQIRREFPAAASDVADASRMLGIIAGRLPLNPLENPHGL